MNVPAVALNAIAEALALLPGVMDSPQARVMLYAIGLQESRFEYRRQLGNGPARGFWQFEQGGGVRGVFRHTASRYWLSKLCEARGVAFTVPAIYAALELDDVFAAGCARLLLFTDQKRLPDVADAESGWGLYWRTWRPGRPHPDTWEEAHAAAVDALGMAPAGSPA